MALYRLYVNKRNLKLNSQDGLERPLWMVETDNKLSYAKEVNIIGPSKLVFNGKKLNGNGPLTWLETEGPIELIGEMTEEHMKTTYRL